MPPMSLPTYCARCVQSGAQRTALLYFVQRLGFSCSKVLEVMATRGFGSWTGRPLAPVTKQQN